MRGDRTAYRLDAAEKDWQGDPVGPPVKQLIAHDVAYIPKVNQDDNSLVAGEALVVFFPGSQNLPGPEDSLEISGTTGVWQIDGDVPEFTKGGVTKAWMCNVRQQR